MQAQDTHPVFFSRSYVSLPWTLALLLTHLSIGFKAEERTPPAFRYLSVLPDDRAFRLAPCPVNSDGT
jgi:hypothetical protein